MNKSIEWRIRHAQRKIKEGKKVGKFTGMLNAFRAMRKTEINEGVRFVHRKGVRIDDKMVIGQSYTKHRV